MLLKNPSNCCIPFHRVHIFYRRRCTLRFCLRHLAEITINSIVFRLLDVQRTYQQAVLYSRQSALRLEGAQVYGLWEQKKSGRACGRPSCCYCYLVWLFCLADPYSVSAAKAAPVGQSLAVTLCKALPAAVSQVLAVTV